MIENLSVTERKQKRLLESHARFSIRYRAENLCYQFVQGNKTPTTVSQDCLLD